MFFNRLKTVILLASLSGLFFLLGYWAGGKNGLIMAFIFSMIMNFVTYFFSDKIVLAMYKAQLLDPEKHADIYAMVKELCFRAEIPMPKLWYIPTSMANAFATGRSPKHASVAVTQGILDILEPNELRGVLAHEISHVKNRDILIGTIAATIATAIGYIAHMMQWAAFFGNGRNDRERSSHGIGALIAAIMMPIAATLIQLAITRSREYLADETGAKCCHDPLALASALEKLHGHTRQEHREPTSNAQTAMASLFIVYPYSGSSIVNLFSTHPPMEKRVARLRQMVGKI
jgi:heat shock protein HtpX